MSSPLVGTPIVSRKRLDEVLIWMVDNERNYCCGSIEIHNGGGAAETILCGTVVADATLSDSSDPLDLQPDFDDAITINDKPVIIPAGQSRDVAALIRGPALVCFDGLVRTSDDESDASLKGRLDAMLAQGVKFKRIPSVTQTSDLNG